MPQPLEGRVALVTGGAKRIGRSIVEKFAAEGADIVINYASSKLDAESLAADVCKLGRRALAIPANVSVKKEVQQMFQKVEGEFGRLDILVNNAGMFFAADFLDLTEEQWDAIMSTNLKAQFLCAQAAAPLLKKSGHGRIVNISSLGGMLPWPKFTHYCVSKAGVIMLTRCLARALAPEILVNSVAPGTIQFPGEEPDEDYIRRAPLHRTGKGSEIADAVFSFATTEFVTGQILAVDGGRSLT
jgi:NAD(P)-dependent dehydrogenase (short-subunit alcohol dehydrogenase family)